MEKLTSSDEYAVFLGGNYPLQVIRGGAGEERLLLIKDSFSHCVAPLLANHFQEVHLIDMRYYRDSVKQYLLSEEISQVLIMYSVDNYSSEKNLVFLNK